MVLQVDPQGNVIERAARFCQQQTQTSKTPTVSGPPMDISPPSFSSHNPLGLLVSQTPSADKGPTVPAFPQAKAKAAESGEKLSEKKSEEIPSTQVSCLTYFPANHVPLLWVTLVDRLSISLCFPCSLCCCLDWRPILGVRPIFRSLGPKKLSGQVRCCHLLRG